MKKIISGKNIVKSYGEENLSGMGSKKRNVLDGISADISEGEFVSIMGPSGSGKTTMLFAMSGMDDIDGGTVSFDGRELAAFGEQELADLRRTQMGFVFQQPTMLVTHDAKIAARTQRILLMRDGKIVSEMKLSKFSGENMDDRMRMITARMQEIGI